MLSRLAPRREAGQVFVMFALLVPVILTIGSIVVSGGNWYVLKRHLQTQVDSAALAGGQGFLGCGQDPATANAAVNAAALKFSGDTLRASSPYNLQLEQAGDQRVVLNSTTYWPDAGSATNGSGYDYTDVSTAADAPKLGAPGGPCYNGYLDVKATDDKAPLLFRFIPLFPSLKSKARVELHELQGGEGLRPIGVPEVDPAVVAVLIVNENAAGGVTSPGAIVNPPAQRILDEQSTLPAGLSGMHVWSKSLTGIDLGGGSQDFHAVIVTSRDPAFTATGSLDSICTGNPTQTFCYTYDGSLRGGVSFIHSYNGGGLGTLIAPIIRDVTLAGGCGVDVSAPARPSNPYFNVDDGTSCNAIGIYATIDFGPLVGPPTADPNCVSVRFTAGSSSGPMFWNGTTWEAFFTPNVGSGRNEIRISADVKRTGSTRTNCSQQQPALSNVLVGAPYVSDDASGPVQYVTLEDTNTGLIANSINKTTNASIKVTVGLTPLLKEAAPTDPPIPLRIWNTPSQSRTLDCLNGASGWNDAMVYGCPAYQIYNPAWHTSGCDGPPAGVPAADPPDCIASKTGNFQDNDAKALWASPCSATPNNWYRNGYGEPPPDDPRWIPLFIVDEKSFLVSGKKYYPVRRFGGFYVTGGSGMGCAGDDPDPLPAGTKRTIYGHFVTYLPQTGGEVIPAAQLCTFTEAGVCVPVLVE